MYFLPAIDILGGKAVRLQKGDYTKVTVYNEDPVLQAQLFEEAGAQWLHVVDLDGAKSGSPQNLDVIQAILQKTELSVEVGGGIRTMDAIARLADMGVNRVVLGTALVKDPDFAQQAIETYGSLLAAGVDAKHGEVAVEGWREGSNLTPKDLAKRMAAQGYRHLIFTDIVRDGMQTGIDPQAYVHMAAAFGHPVIASGGIATIRDIQTLSVVADSVEGVIAGRAIYEGSLSVEDAVAVCEGTMDVEPLPPTGTPLSVEDLQDFSSDRP